MKKALLTLGCASLFAVPALARNFNDWGRSGAGAWARFDTNRDGVIVAEELRAHGVATGPEMQSIDTDRNGYLEPREVAHLNPNQVITWANQSFYGNNDFPSGWDALDSNDDGRIDHREVQDAGYALTPELRRLDANGDNVLSPYEVRSAGLPSSYQYSSGYYNNPGYYNNSTGYYNNNSGYYGNELGYNWRALDLNRDGIVQNWELRRAGYNTNRNYNLGTLDQNGDGYISQWEMNRYNNGNYYGNPGVDLNNGRVNIGDFFNALNLLRIPGLIR